jgi:hypothetical protein
MTAELQRLWSVTTLIKLGLGTSDALVNWAVRVTAEAAVHKRGTVDAMIRDEGPDAAVSWLRDARWRTTGKAQLRGTLVHEVAEALALGNEPPALDVALLPYVDQLTRWLELHKPRFIMAEAPVYNPELRYAGTLDSIVELYERNLLLDIKTTEHGPTSDRARPPFPEVALQTCAYSRCTQVGVLKEQRYAGGKRYYLYDPTAKHEPLPRIDGALCLVISPEDCFAVPVRIDDSVWQAWLTVLDAARWQQRGTHDIFGPPLPPPGAATELEEQLQQSLQVMHP